MYDALILSDLHLGAEACQVKTIQHFLEELPATRRVILNGDVLENTEHRLTKSHWKVLSQLRKWSDDLELVWVSGNHDQDADAIAHLIGATFVREYEFQSGGRNVLCVHGDVWDKFLTEHPLVTWVADVFYLWMQRLSRSLAVTAKRRSKTFLRCVEKVRVEAIEYARIKDADIVLCGHTHHAESFEAEGHGGRPLTYCNVGCWTDHHCHFCTVQDGVPQMHEVNADRREREAAPENARGREAEAPRLRAGVAPGNVLTSAPS
jgi:UDP-2,3-diacylglucosamine pyrophosphatase LpxH